MAANSLRRLAAAPSAFLATDPVTFVFSLLVVVVFFLGEDEVLAVEFAFVFFFLSFTATSVGSRGSPDRPLFPLKSA